METNHNNTTPVRRMVIDPASSGLPYGPFNSEQEANNFIADRNLTSPVVVPEVDIHPMFREEFALVRMVDGTWVRA